MKRGILMVFLSILLLGSSSYANSNLFYPYVIFPTGSWPEAVAIGDVNGDGRNDVVLITSFYFDPENDNRIFVFLQDSFGLLQPPIKYQMNCTNPSSLDIADVNHDGKADVVVGCGSNIQVFLQNASGTLDPGIIYPTANSYSIKIADLNNDGLLDVVGIGWGTGTADILFQNQNGTLNPPVTYAVNHGGYDEVDVGDVNNDGLTDIIVMSGQLYSTSNVGVLYQQPNGSFSAPVYYDLGGNELTRGVAVGDISGDNLKDLVVSYGGNSPSSKIGIFLQNNSGTMNPAVSYSSYDCPEAVVTADVNGDGKKDIIVAHGGWDALGIYLQGANGSLLPEELYPLPYATTYNPQGLAVGDINGDGYNDVVLADYNHGLVVLYNIHGPAIPRINVYPSSLNFGSVFLGNSISQDITIYNSGTGSLTVSAIEITGQDAAAFSKTNSCSTIGPGTTCMFTVTFNAITEGEKNATLTITSNGSNTPTLQVTLFAYTGKPLFIPYINFPVGSWPEAVAIGDVNGDGRNDVVMTTSYYFNPENDYHIFVFLQNPSGGLDAPIKYPTNSSYTNRSQSIDIGDVNHDGRADIVVGNCGSNIEIFMQNASGSLDPGVSFPTVNSCSIKIGDLNNDGLLDVVGCGGTSVDIFFQNINGTLNPPVTYSIANGSCAEVDIGDVNNDGLKDIILIGTRGIGLLFQQPGGTFSIPVYYSLTGNQPYGGAVGDVNGDGLQDIVVSYGGNWPDSKIAVFLQNRAATFDPLVSYDSYDIPEPVVIADVNNDGKKDVIVAHGGWDALGVYLQGTSGTLMPEELYSIPYASQYKPQGLAVGDINGDGYNDVVIADYNNGLVVLYNVGLCTTPGIVSHPQSQPIPSGQKATLSVTASGTAPLTYQWYQGLSGNTSTPVGGNSSSYTTPVLTQTTSYWVRVSNWCGYVNSNTATISVMLPPVAPSLISPSGAIITTTPTYTWIAISNATDYQIQINDPSGMRMMQWYTAAACGCASGTGTCSITPAVALNTGACQWWAQAKNGAGTGPWSTGVSFTVSLPPPPAATLISPTGTVTTATPTYIWNAVSSSTWYYLSVNDSTGNRILQWYTASAAGCPSGTGTCSVTPSVSLNAGAGSWKVQTWSSAGYGPWSSSMSFTVDIPAPPPAPTLISPSGTVTTTSPTYTWNAIFNATDYQIQINDSSGMRMMQWFTATDCGCGSGRGTCSLPPLVSLNEGTGQWWVQAKNAIGIGPWSAGMSFTVSLPPPPATTLVSPTGTITTATPTYIWNAVSSSTWYYLSVNDSTGNRILQWYTAQAAGCPSGIGTCSVTPSVSLNAGAASWKVQTYSSAGYGPWSASMSFMVDIPAPLPAPVLLSPSGTITTAAPTYTWNAISNATDYQIQINDSSGMRMMQWYTAAACGCASGTGTCSITPALALNQGTCQWWAQARNAAGTSPWSSGMPFTFTIPPLGPATLISPSGTIATNTPTYIWNAVSASTWYNLYVNDSTGNRIQQWYTSAQCGCVSGTGTCSITPSVILNSGAGRWWIQTNNSAGLGPWSAPTDFTVP